MKKILSILFMISFIFAFTGCSNHTDKERDTSSEPSSVSTNNSSYEHNKSQTDSAKETKTMKTINIIVGNKTFTAALEDNDTAKALVKQLPLTVDMSELNGNEKYNYLSGNLRADTPASPGRINAGDLMLYGNNCLVLFYKTFNTSYSYIKLGRIENTSGLTEALGSDSVKVTFSVSE
ncbi:cyclophilin-like fold protein [Bacillus sp. USDA818B3_A]|uniref:cyclophilin-like fold protein n=1 Tax=Bacillus sp. USDA818B3_A TaxID=2698834 RepID=UPI00136AE8F8|nr:cyclophilin-like fold protein [Bacillus sp. USDA818B3_A]